MKSVLPVSVFVSLLFVGCSSPSEPKSESPHVENPISDIPTGAVREKFADNPAMEKVSLKDVGGHLLLEGTLVDGKKEGAWVELNPNGTAKSITPYVHDQKEGEYIELNSSGQFVKRVAYHHNLRHGEYQVFNYSSLKEERFYQNDKLEGTVKTYYDNSVKVMEEGTYKNGTRDGISRWYDQEGKMTIEYEYKSGELVKK
jgi:antitoxin component YwqK of YwqJK toxin-antitoxin module